MPEEPAVTPVVLVGASIRAAAESARRAGFSVTGLDLFGDADARRACDRYLPLSGDLSPSELVDRLPEAPAVVVGGLGGTGRLLSLLKSRGSVLGSPQRWPASERSLRQLREIARRSGVSVPSTCLGGPLPRHPDGGRWLEKDVSSSGGSGVRWSGAGDRSISPHRWRQRWVAGRAYGATFLAAGRSAALLGVCRSSYTHQSGRPFTYAGSFGPVAVAQPVTSRLIRFGQAFAASGDVRGLFNVDVIADRAGQIWVLEINRRWSASCEVLEQALMPRGPGTSQQTLFQWHWQAITGGEIADRARQAIRRGEPLEAGADAVPRVWKRIVYANRTGRFDPRRLNPVGATREAMEVRFADLPQPATRLRRGEPLLTVICRQDSRSSMSWQARREVIASAQLAVVPDR